MMKACIVRQLSDDLSGVEIGEAVIPQPGEGEVLVRVVAAGVNFPDLLMCQGRYQFKPEPPFIPGMEVAGIVEAVGAGVDADWLKQRVAGGGRLGGFAEYFCAPVEAIRAIPASMSDTVAAGYQTAYLTAYVALVRRAALQAGETILIHGAAGGVGLAAVDVALRLGATVIATASTPEKQAFITAYGAHHVLASSGFRLPVKDITRGAGVDVVYDPVGGDVMDESLRCLAFGARVLVVGFAGGRISSVSANIPLIKGASIVGVRAGEFGRQYPHLGRENLETIWRWAQEGVVRPHVQAALPLDDAKDALQRLTERQVIGKLVLTP